MNQDKFSEARRLAEKLRPQLVGRLRASLAPELHDRIEDAAHEAVASLFEATANGKFEHVSDAAMLKWLQTTARNKVLEGLRKTNKEKSAGSWNGSVANRLLQSSMFRPSRIVAGAELRVLLLIEISKLPDRYQAVLRLRWFEELDFAEIAQRLGVDPETGDPAAQMRGIHRSALNLLRARMSHLEGRSS